MPRGSRPSIADLTLPRLTELLGYVEQVIKLDQRPAFRCLELKTDGAPDKRCEEFLPLQRILAEGIDFNR